jgi:predicted nucleic acid-binding protein
MRPLVESDPHQAVWWGTLVEAQSALGRRERDGELDLGAAAEAQHRLVTLASAWTEIAPAETLRRVALRLLRVHHPLRTSDALQLAAALSAAAGVPEDLAFATLDDRLRVAARREGFVVLPAAAY